MTTYSYYTAIDCSVQLRDVGSVVVYGYCQEITSGDSLDVSIGHNAAALSGSPSITAEDVTKMSLADRVVSQKDLRRPIWTFKGNVASDDLGDYKRSSKPSCVAWMAERRSE
jgi:hypothetical protein